MHASRSASHFLNDQIGHEYKYKNNLHGNFVETEHNMRFVTEEFTFN